MNNHIIIEGEFTLIPDDSWRERLVSARDRMVKRTIPAFIEFCREVHAFRLDCDATQGGSEFSQLGCEWLGVSTSTLHGWDAVGRRADELSGTPESLPASEDAIRRLCQLDDIAFPKALEHVRPDMTQKEVRELVKDLDQRPEPTEQDIEEGFRRKRDRLCRQFEALPERDRAIFCEVAGLTAPEPNARELVDRLVESAPMEAADLYRDLGRSLPDTAYDRLEAAKEAYLNLSEQETVNFRQWMEDSTHE